MGGSTTEDHAARTFAKVISFTIQPISIGMAVSVIVPLTVYRDSSIAFLPILVGCIFIGLFPLVPILIAVARQLLVILNAMLRDNRKLEARQLV